LGIFSGLWVLVQTSLSQLVVLRGFNRGLVSEALTLFPNSDKKVWGVRGGKPTCLSDCFCHLGPQVSPCSLSLQSQYLRTLGTLCHQMPPTASSGLKSENHQRFPESDALRASLRGYNPLKLGPRSWGKALPSDSLVLL
jgi:hypothetical protein